MSIAEQVKSRIEQWEPGRVMTYDDFADLNSFQAVALNLSRLQKVGVIERLSKGRYYKPRKSKFAQLKPTESEILSSILKKNGGYIAGPAALNRMGLSTQVPSEITIAGSRSNRKLEIANLRLRFVKGPDLSNQQLESSVTDVIEALKRIRSVPAGDVPRVLAKIISVIGTIDSEQLEKLVELALRSRPFVRALLGAMLENAGRSSEMQERLKNSLNPLTNYKLRLSGNVLSNSRQWRIK